MSCLLSPAPASEMILRRCKFEHQWLYSSWVCLSSCPPGGPAAHSITPPVPCTLLAADLDIHHGGVLHLPLDVLVLPRGSDRVPAAVARLRHRQPDTSSRHVTSSQPITAHLSRLGLAFSSLPSLTWMQTSFLSSSPLSAPIMSSLSTPGHQHQ